MKNLKLLFFVTLCLVLGLGIASANINIDETFDTGTPFTDRGWAYGVDSPTSAMVKGVSIYRNGLAAYASTGTLTINTTGTLAINMTSGNLQGSLKNLGTGAGRAWQLTAGQKIFFGQSGNALYPSGGGFIADNGSDIKVCQVGLGYDVNQIPNSSTSTLIGSVSYLFGNTARTTTTFSLTYELRPNATGGDAFVRELRSDGTSRTLGTVQPNKFSMLTTVWAAGADKKWGTIPKTGWGMTMYPSGIPGFPRGFGWQVNKAYISPTDATAFNTYEGSADGRLYPKGKGWANGAALTSSTTTSSGTLQPNMAVYSFLDTKPVSYGTTTSKPLFVDNPWLIPSVLYPVPGKISVLSTTETTTLKTWKIAAGNTSATLYVDDLYMEATIRGADPTAAEAKAADYRIHEFDQKLVYFPNKTTLLPNPQYVGPTGLPVELSIFDVR